MKPSDRAVSTTPVLVASIARRAARIRSTDSVKSNSGFDASPVESSIERPAMPVAVAAVTFVATDVTAADAAGIAGLSIEDSTGEASNPLFDFTLSVERIRAARRAIDATSTGVVLTARSEGFICGRPDLQETIRRLTAYA